jgi:Uri superfamily endonuclease
MPKKKLPETTQGGAYILHLRVLKNLSLQVGSLGIVDIPAGQYVYVGSARKSISGRVDRHRRLAVDKTGKLHWHIDYLLIHPEIELFKIDTYIGHQECNIAGRIERSEAAFVPVPDFGSSDCRSGCKAHFFHVKNSEKITSLLE